MQIPSLPAVWSLASYLTSLSLHFLFAKQRPEYLPPGFNSRPLVPNRTPNIVIPLHGKQEPCSQCLSAPTVSYTTTPSAPREKLAGEASRERKMFNNSEALTSSLM